MEYHHSARQRMNYPDRQPPGFPNIMAGKRSQTPNSTNETRNLTGESRAVAAEARWKAGYREPQGWQKALHLDCGGVYQDGHTCQKPPSTHSSSMGPSPGSVETDFPALHCPLPQPAVLVRSCSRPPSWKGWGRFALSLPPPCRGSVWWKGDGMGPEAEEGGFQGEYKYAKGKG